ncbi:MAG: hypothetical protein EHM72_20845 [Calditrichaeota bacterium]|nr:MAG: hypothetical protein EHM72_20845 [Calditrichota bacterium]
MKKIACLLLLSIVPLMAQEQTLFSGKYEHGGYGGPFMQFTQMKGSSAIMVGGRGGWIINHSFVLGGGGYGLASPIKAGLYTENGEELYLQAGFGGLMLEYYFEPNRLWHFSVQSFIGGGSVNYSDRRYDNDEWDDRDHIYGDDTFFYLEPGLTLTLNLTKFMRIGAGASYR